MKLLANPSAPITANGEYECHSEYAVGDTVAIEIYGVPGPVQVQPCLIDPAGGFLPLAAASAIRAFVVQVGTTGKVGFILSGADGTTSLKAASSPKLR